MKIAFYDTKPYDKIWFEPLAAEYGYGIKFIESRLSPDTCVLSHGCGAVCAFVNDDLGGSVIRSLADGGIKLILLRCAGFNNVDLAAAKDVMPVLRVPSYSPEAVAEHAMALILGVNRKIHKAFIRTRDFNFNINGLMGVDLNKKVAGVVGTGKIGRAMIHILKGFNMRVLAYDAYPDSALDVEYVGLDELFEKSDVISLHCPLNENTFHIINDNAVAKMKDGVIIVNTSRGALVDTSAVIEGLKSLKIGGLGLDVYEEEEECFFEDKSDQIQYDEELARLMTFPNVIVTSHQAFFTREAMQAIALCTMENLYAFTHSLPLENEVRA